MTLLRLAALTAALVFALPTGGRAEDSSRLELRKGDKIVLIGNTLAERMQLFGGFETLLYSRFPDLDLVVRDLGWSADELTLRPRSMDFQDHGHELKDEKPTVLIAMFGFNESFAGPAGLEKFKADLAAFVDEVKSTAYDGKEPPRLVLVSPIAHEDLGRRELPDGSVNNANLKLYTQAMGEIAASKGVVFVDVLDKTMEAMGKDPKPWTINGIHLNEHGDEWFSILLDQGLFGARPAGLKADLARLRSEVNEKNKQFYYDYRAVNGYYIYGGRKEPFGVVNFPAEFAKLRAMTARRDERIWALAKGEDVSPSIDDSGTGEFVDIPTNVTEPIKLTTPEETLASFKLPDGFAINLFASEREFPELRKPVQMTFDTKGRLWIATMESYPMYLPGTPVDDKILIFEDTDGDGRADKRTIFADGLYLPTGLELGDGGVYVAQQPNLVFLKDTDGDDRADVREIRLHGFDSADSHHSISDFVWDPGGALYMSEGTFHHTQVETPYGPCRVKDAAYFRYEPRTEKLDVYISYPFANPWGHTWDAWGVNYIADASGGANYYGAAFSGDVDYPRKHGGLKQWFPMQWRPTAGCEIVSSGHFPDDWQGHYLLNNCIGFQGTLHYTVREEGSGIAGAPAEPLLQSTDRNFRPVDLEFAPDGSLYICDWFNPLIGHMQHSVRDPNRDAKMGRIWRITNLNKPLVKPPAIDGRPVPELLDVLKVYEDRTRYRARIELRSRPTEEVITALGHWVGKLDRNDPSYWHHVLEALWMHQQHDVVDEALLKTVLRCDEPRARAAATRVLCYWRDRVAEPLELLRTQVNDENPRVRLEAVRALSFFRGADAVTAQEVALESLLHPQDDYLEYVLNETNATLDARIKDQEGK